VAIGELYREGRLRISDLVLSLSDEETKRTVPTCPLWTVSDVVAHVTGICADVLAGNIAGVASEPWTAAQVMSRRGRSTAQLISEWSELAPQVESFADSFPEPMGPQWIADLTTHEHDIRTAVGKPGARDSLGMEVGLDFLVAFGLDQSIAAHGLAPLTVRAGEATWVVGTADNGSAEGSETLQPVLTAPPFDLFRALTGRRSNAQVGLLGWSVDAAPYVAAFRFGPFTPSPNDIVE
jgi:uncharacterized protein (TIGR03083 family)